MNFVFAIENSVFKALRCFGLTLGILGFIGSGAAQADLISVGSKDVTEQFILSEIIAQLIESKTALTVRRRFNLAAGNFIFQAIRHGDIDCYVEYTGSALINILRESVPKNREVVYSLVENAFQERFGIIVLKPLGFENKFALAVRQDDPRFEGIDTVSDLVPLTKSLKFAGNHRFLDRQDGFVGLSSTYQLKFRAENITAMNQGLIYEAIHSRKVDVAAAFSTDGRIMAFDLRLLDDDKDFFPPYQAVPIIRADVLEKYPYLRKVLGELAGKISHRVMLALNDRVDRGHESVESVARSFLVEAELVSGKLEKSSMANTLEQRVEQGFFALFWSERLSLWKQVKQHLMLTLVALLFALMIALPTGVALSRFPKLSGPVFAIVNAVQTIPSLALFGFLIPLVGIGAMPAIIALFLYALLPLISNTYTGISEVDDSLIDACKGMGLTSGQILRKVEIPLAFPVIMAGIRTSTVLMVGTATLAALIGGGGLGEPILLGVSTLDTNRILLGAIPAAALAILIDRLLLVLERRSTRPS